MSENGHEHDDRRSRHVEEGAGHFEEEAFAPSRRGSNDRDSSNGGSSSPRSRSERASNGRGSSEYDRGDTRFSSQNDHASSRDHSRIDDFGFDGEEDDRSERLARPQDEENGEDSDREPRESETRRKKGQSMNGRSGNGRSYQPSHSNGRSIASDENQRARNGSRRERNQSDGSRSFGGRGSAANEAHRSR